MPEDACGCPGGFTKMRWLKTVGTGDITCSTPYSSSPKISTTRNINNQEVRGKNAVRQQHQPVCPSVCWRQQEAKEAHGRRVCPSPWQKGNLGIALIPTSFERVVSSALLWQKHCWGLRSSEGHYRALGNSGVGVIVSGIMGKEQTARQCCCW